MLDTYIMCVRALQLAKRERMVKTGREREGVTEREGEGWRGRALVLAEFIEVGVKKCYTYSKHTGEKPHR